MQTISRWLCVLAPAIFIASTAWSEPIARATGNRPANAIAKSATTSSQHRAPAGLLPTTAQHARMAIATFLERQERFRKYDNEGAPKLIDARIAGPTEDTQPFYCVYVNLVMTNRILWVTHDALLAVVSFPPSDNGQQRIVGRVKSLTVTLSASATCHNIPYTPFPELEHLRAQRRHALGKSDT